MKLFFHIFISDMEITLEKVGCTIIETVLISQNFQLSVHTLSSKWFQAVGNSKVEGWT